MARYRVAEGRELSHSEPVNVEVPTIPQREGPGVVVRGYEGRLLQAGDKLELPESEAKSLLDAGVIEKADAKKRRRK